MDKFKTTSIVSTDEFLELWTKAELYNSHNGRHDQNSWDRINLFRTLKVTTNLVEIIPDVARNQILIPYHDGSNHFFKTKQYGETLDEFINSYSFSQIEDNLRNACSESIQYHINYFIDQKNKSFVEGICMHCTNNVSLSPDKESKQGSFLYAGSFHQFAAYAFFIVQYEPIPLRLYYVCT